MERKNNFVAANCDPVARKKIKELEKAAGGGSGGGANVITYTVQLADDFTSTATCDKTFDEVKNLLLNYAGNNVQTIVKVVSAYDLVIDTAMIHMNGYNDASEVDVSFKYLFAECKLYHSYYDGEENISVEGLDVPPV